MEYTQIDNAVSTRARVRISENHGWAAGKEGIAMGYHASYNNLKVGFVDEAGEYTGESTVIPLSAVELVDVARHKDSRPDADAIFLPDLVAADGVVWTFWKGSIYRNGRGGAVPSEMLPGARQSDYGTWV
jgi:hypothetical protein